MRSWGDTWGQGREWTGMAALGCPHGLTSLGAGPWWSWKRRCVRLAGVMSDLGRKPNGRALGDPVLWVQDRSGQKLQGLPGGSVVKTLPAAQETGFYPWVRKIPWRRSWQPAPVFLPGESHGQRSLEGYSPGGCQEADTTEWLTHTLTQTHTVSGPTPAAVGPPSPTVLTTTLHEARSQSLCCE